jgi:hypothetical protein
MQIPEYEQCRKYGYPQQIQDVRRVCTAEQCIYKSRHINATVFTYIFNIHQNIENTGEKESEKRKYGNNPEPSEIISDDSG